jgi:hypothetical protein
MRGMIYLSIRKGQPVVSRKMRLKAFAAAAATLALLGLGLRAPDKGGISYRVQTVFVEPTHMHPLTTYRYRGLECSTTANPSPPSSAVVTEAMG